MKELWGIREDGGCYPVGFHSAMRYLFERHVALRTLTLKIIF
jgi:hypothetical protein